MHLIDYFENEYYISGYPYRYDMYFEKNDKRYFVEMDGSLGHGHKSSKNSFIKKTPEETKQRDKDKDVVAEKSGIEMIRVDATLSTLKHLKSNILNSKLSTLFDLELVDFNKAYEFTLKNLCKEVCIYKRDHPEVFTMDLCKIFHLSHSCVLSYLHKGTDIGWCNFDGTEEHRRYAETHLVINNNYKCISVTNITTGEKDYYYSLAQLEEESLQKYNIKMWRHTVKTKLINDQFYYLGYFIEEISKDDYIKIATEKNLIDKEIL